MNTQNEVEKMLNDNSDFFDCVVKRAAKNFTPDCDPEKLLLDAVLEQKEFVAKLAFPENENDRERTQAASEYVAESVWTKLNHKS